MYGEWYFHLTPVAMMATILIINHTINGRRNRKRAALEGTRLATALAVELQSMLDGYIDNLSLIDRDAPILLAARGAGTQVYRGNMARMVTLLDERLVGVVVAAYVHHERIEGLLTACSQPNTHFMLRAGAGGAYHDQLRRRYAAGCELAEAAISALALAWPVAGVPDPAAGNVGVESTDLPIVVMGQVP